MCVTTEIAMDDDADVKHVQVRVHGLHSVLGHVRTQLLQHTITFAEYEGLLGFALYEGVFVTMCAVNNVLCAYVTCANREETVRVQCVDEDVVFLHGLPHFSVHSARVTPEHFEVNVCLPIGNVISVGAITPAKFTLDINRNYVPIDSRDEILYSFQLNAESDDVTVVGKFVVAPSDAVKFNPAQAVMSHEIRRYADGHCVLRTDFQAATVEDATFRHGMLDVLRYHEGTQSLLRFYP